MSSCLYVEMCYQFNLSTLPSCDRNIDCHMMVLLHSSPNQQKGRWISNCVNGINKSELNVAGITLL